MDIFLHSPNTSLSASEDVFLVQKNDVEHPFHPQRITRLWVPIATPISAEAMALSLRAGVDIILLNEEHIPVGTLAAYTQRKGASLLRKQITLTAQPEADRQVSLYILLGQQGRVEILREAGLSERQLASLENMLLTHQNLFGTELPLCSALREAAFARTYFRLLATALPAWTAFEKRTRRPATDVFSAALNYGMGWMYAVQYQAIRRAYLNPYWGFHHRPKDGEPALVFDLIEAQRPWVEAGVLALFHKEELQPQHFRRQAETGAVKINKVSRRRIIQHLHERYQEPLEDGKSRMSKLYDLARGVARRIESEPL